MTSWSAVWLHAFGALQLIVAYRAGAEAALKLRSWSTTDRYGLRYLDDGEKIRSAFAEAERDLQAWCRQGLVAARGRRIVGHYGERSGYEDLTDWWSTTRDLDFERSALRGSPTFLDVELRKSDVELLMMKHALPAASPPVEVPLIKRRGPMPRYSWGAAEAAIEEEIARRGWPDEDGPSQWRCQGDVEQFIRDFLRDRHEGEPAESTTRTHVSQILDRLRPTKAGN